ncbi:phosphatidate cytidylyltransferase [Synechocystis sp. PCC 7339]|uniref:diacylglycerol/polyprenol kinase family protein n=1 Tax=unclassified Synechocystis TaxID=2640012 RepID=UPI001BAEE138|nr:phosphatidate cytidylyltransferase [Synechocystis sp. PCC 7338]UAJ72118.1 phosphatidate cytidylyltransferase [Synechocystis sp. PCC 7339]
MGIEQNSPMDLSLWMAVGLAATYLGAVVLTAELLNRLSPSPAEVTRKIVHIGAGQVVLIAWWLDIPGWVGAIAGVFAAGIALLSYRLPILPSLESVGRHSYGTLFYALSIGLLVGGFFSVGLPVFAAIGILVMAWGDGMAALVGQKWGRHRYEVFGFRKSWEGTLVMVLASFLVTVALLGYTFGFTASCFVVAGMVAIASAGLESFSRWGIDNLTVPMGSALIAFGGSYLWLG